MTAERTVLSVSQLTDQLRGVVEEKFPAVWVEGEISNFRLYTSGHAYFTLKDENAQLRAVLFRTRMRRLRFEPGDGQHVLAFGSLEVYAQRGEYQLVVELLEPRGLGALQLAFEQLKQRLGAEGLFDQARKRSLPRFPRKIGVATSPSGAVIRDILRVIGRRFAGLHIVIAPCRVGSLEDLWAFNEEVVARAIAGSKIPVISAVGHEVDVTIADFAADLRAPTPSAAAELVVREKQAIVDGLDTLRRRLDRAVRRPLTDLERRVDDVRGRLDHAGRVAHDRVAHRVALLTARLKAASPFNRLGVGRHRLDRVQGRLHGAVAGHVVTARHRLVNIVGRLESLSPLAVLGRGYSLTRTPEGAVVRRAGDVRPGSRVDVLLSEGVLDCRVESTRERDDRPQV